MDNYSIDLKKFQLSEYKSILQNKDMLPGRVILKENLDANFKTIEKEGITNVDELINTLKTKKKIEAFATKTGLSIDYLTILRREANAYISKPVHLKEFPCISKAFVETLAKHGILHTKHYFELSITSADRKNMQKISDASMEEVLQLTKLSNLVRINSVGPLFSTMLLDTGYDTIEKILESDDQKIFEALELVNQNKKYYKGNIVFSDIAYIKNFAGKLPLITEF